jgi:hypothetical protein
MNSCIRTYGGVNPCNGGSVPQPDFTIKQHDTRPSFKAEITDCDAPIDLAELVIEASMWANAKLKCNISADETKIQFADNIGFQQLNYDTIIQVGEGRLFERMLIDQINDVDSTVTVFRGQMDTGSYPWKKGTPVKLMRFLNNPARGELVYGNIDQPDGTIINDVLVTSLLMYDWLPQDTCMAGVFYFEFKILKLGSVPTPCSGSLTVVPAPIVGNRALPPLNGMPTFMPPGGGAQTACTSGGPVDYSIYVPPVRPYVSCDRCISAEQYFKENVSGNIVPSPTVPPQYWPANYSPPLPGGYVTEQVAQPVYMPHSVPIPNVQNTGMVQTPYGNGLTPDYYSCCNGCWPPPWNPPVSQINYHCGMGPDVEWVRRFPTNKPGFVIEIYPSPTAE